VTRSWSRVGSSPAGHATAIIASRNLMLGLWQTQSQYISDPVGKPLLAMMVQALVCPTVDPPSRAPNVARVVQHHPHLLLSVHPCYIWCSGHLGWAPNNAIRGWDPYGGTLSHTGPVSWCLALHTLFQVCHGAKTQRYCLYYVIVN
jgi:hypothetical protein